MSNFSSRSNIHMWPADGEMVPIIWNLSLTFLNRL